jgi:hypothetical protein
MILDSASLINNRESIIPKELGMVDRVTRRSDPVAFSQVITYSDGQKSTTNRSDTVEVKLLIRDGITKVKLGANGWRSPTNYKLSDLFVEPYNGVIQVDYRVPLVPSNNQQRSYSGYLPLVGSTSILQPLPAAFYGPSSSDYWPSNNLINKTVTKALLKARDQKVNLAVSLAEAHKSIDMITSSVTSIVSAYSALRKGNISKAFQSLGLTKRRTLKGTAFSDRWLEMQYGWLPLLGDVHGAYEELTRTFRKHGIRFKVTARGSESSNATGIVKGQVASGPDQRWSCQTEKRVQVILHYEVSNPYLLQASAVGLINPFEIAWELIPFSFVIDWFIPVGNVLGCLTADSGLTFMGGTLTQTSLSNSSASLISVPTVDQGSGMYASKTSIYAFGETTRRRYDFKRTLYNSSPFAQFYYQNPFSTGHALNALALLRSTIKPR